MMDECGGGGLCGLCGLCSLRSARVRDRDGLFDLPVILVAVAGKVVVSILVALVLGRVLLAPCRPRLLLLGQCA